MDERSACYEEIKDVIALRFGELGLPVVKNIAYTTTGLVYLAGSHRGWYDRLTVSGLARVLPVKGKMKNRLKRLMRFLDNARFEINVVTPGLVRMTGYRDIIPVLVDETTAGGVEVITGSCPVEGRSIPVGFATFEKDKIPTSRNDLEDAFLSRLARVLPREIEGGMDHGSGVRPRLLDAVVPEEKLAVHYSGQTGGNGGV